jgi:pantoate--beta-alanine ligase
MQIIKTKSELRSLISDYKHKGWSIGFVPTMGYLHEGHGSLIRLAKNECDIVIVSIFINPLQFGANEDLDKYPQDIPADTALCQKNNVDILYIPEAQDILGANMQPLTYVNITELDQNLCGTKRHGHFRGVCTIVAKLFNIVAPDRAYFGKKDIQQLRIIEQMVTDLDFPVQIIGGETFRGSDGLALSSRNAYLSDEEHRKAVIVPQALNLIRELIGCGIINSNELIKRGQEFITRANITNAKLDYLEIVDNKSLQKVSEVKQGVIIAIALYIGKTRLIDNIII